MPYREQESTLTDGLFRTCGIGEASAFIRLFRRGGNAFPPARNKKMKRRVLGMKKKRWVSGGKGVSVFLPKTACEEYHYWEYLETTYEHEE